MAGTKFNKRYVDAARREFHKVYIDRTTPDKVIGSETKYTGDRIRIYETSWYYEEPVIIKTNEEFMRWLEQELDTIYDGIEFAKPVLA